MSRSLKFHEVFQLEMEGWVRGMKSFNKSFSSQHMHAIIQELQPAFREAIRRGYAFKIVKIANDFANVKKVCSAKEVAFIILAALPKLSELNGNEAIVLGEIYAAADQAFGGVYQRFGGAPALTGNQSKLPEISFSKSAIFARNPV